MNVKNIIKINKKNARGITLISLVITIIVLSILAVITIQMLQGDNTIVIKTADVVILKEIEQLEEEANLLCLQTLKRTHVDVSLDDIVNQLKTKGYTIETVQTSGTTVTGLSLDNTRISMAINELATITVSYDVEPTGNLYYAVIRGKNYRMKLKENEITISRTETDLNSSPVSNELTAISSDNCVTIGSITGNTITLNGASNGGKSIITVNYGNFTATCFASVSDGETTFSTDYGTIDVIWLSGTSNTVTSTPNAPVLSGMTPVKWTEEEGGWNETPVETTSSDTSWYNYNAVSTREQNGHTTDNLTSKWANAKNTTDGGDSYFVWIPRYAYRITYYSSETDTEPTGYYDGWGQWRASDGSIRLALDEGIETVDYGGNKYIVHPAFCGSSVGYDNGSWDKDISGFWIAKYEMSRIGATRTYSGSVNNNTIFLSVPNVQSARNITVGNLYTCGKNYDTSKESHLIKNSEWGAVAYLAHSQFGRNGNEIDINNSNITGNGGGSVAQSMQGTVNDYNTTIGAKASTTGNVYGIYDMSGGAEEYVAVFNNTDSNDYESTYGSTFASTSGTSDKYVTKYYNTDAYGDSYGMSIYGKIGDATKEVNKGGKYIIGRNGGQKSWFNGKAKLPFNGAPFSDRGGRCDYGTSADIFTSEGSEGRWHEGETLRVVLCPE